MVRVRIFVEGGKKAASTACRSGFKEFLSEVVPRSRFDILASGGRQEALRDFQNAGTATGFVNVLLIDSETARRELPDPGSGLFEMVQCMECWIIADRECLKSRFGSADFEALPSDIEGTSPNEAFVALQAATQGAYRKGSPAFETLALARPSRVAAKAKHAAHFFESLRSLTT